MDMLDEEGSNQEIVLAFVGAGRMAEAIIAGVLESGMYAPEEVAICDKALERCAYMAQQYGVGVVEHVQELAALAPNIVLAVKPQDIGGVLTELAPVLNQDHLLISIIAGMSIATLTRLSGGQANIVRVMPNLAMQVQEGMSVYCTSPGCATEDAELVQQIFGCAGAVLELEEQHFDTVTALSGSGPAFVAYFIQAMVETAVGVGMDEDQALFMATQSVIGTGVYLQHTNSSAASFMQAVASPRGTTAAGLAVLEKSDLKEIVFRTLIAARERSMELAKGKPV